jgi:hypothetical protein
VKSRRFDRESTRLRERAFLIEKKSAIQRVEHQRHEARRAKQASRDVHHVCALGWLCSDRNFEFRVKEMLGYGSSPKFFRIFAYQGLEFGDRARRIVKRTADVNFARVNLHMKSERMTKLIDAAGTSGDAVLDRLAHRANFTVKKIDVMAPNLEPSAAVHRRSPLAKRSHQSIKMTIVKLLRSRSQSRRREWIGAGVIDSEIDIRSFIRVTARA